MLKSTGASSSFSEILGKAFGWVPLHPNTITLLSIVFAIGGFWFFLINEMPLGFAFFLLAFAADAIDGAVARAKGLISKNGAFLDGISDRIVEFFLIGALYVSFLDVTSQLFLVSILFFGTCMTAFVKAYSEHSGILPHDVSKSMPGYLERAERSVLLLLVPMLHMLGYGTYVVYLLALITFLSVATFLQRTEFAMRAGQQAEKEG